MKNDPLMVPLKNSGGLKYSNGTDTTKGTKAESVMPEGTNNLFDSMGSKCLNMLMPESSHSSRFYSNNYLQKKVLDDEHDNSFDPNI